MLRVGIVGVGWGSLVQAPAFQAVPGYELVALCARRAETAEAAGLRLGVSDTSSDWTSFVRRDDLDLISVATPTDSHAEITLAALAAGKHVLCEKPLTNDALVAADVVAAAHDTGLTTAICFETRWLPERYSVRRLVEDGMVGAPYSIRLDQSASYWHPTHALQSLWMYDEKAGGGYLANLVVHDIDYVCALFGEPVAVCADVRSSIPERELPDGTSLRVTADDTAAILMRLQSGAVAILTASMVGAHVSPETRLDVFGQAGTVQMIKTGGGAHVSVRAGLATSDGLAEQDLASAAVPGLTERQRTKAGGMVNCMGLMLAEWLPAFDGQPTAVPTFADGLRAQRVIDAARASASGAGWVDLR